MPCSNSGQSIILVMAEASISAFEAVVPALQAVGKLSPTAATAITGYVNTAVTALETVVTDLKSGTSTLSKIASIVQAIVTAYDGVATALPPGLSLWVNVANIAIQSLLGAIQAEIGPVAVAPAAVAHAAETIHPGFFGTLKLDGLQKRLQKVESEVAVAATA